MVSSKISHKLHLKKYASNVVKIFQDFVVLAKLIPKLWSLKRLIVMMSAMYLKIESQICQPVLALKGAH